MGAQALKDALEHLRLAHEALKAFRPVAAVREIEAARRAVEEALRYRRGRLVD